mmetsp:Transcript_2439/g.3853  ORF Transcript_2439/g.3853 Transcript_2439/m.3853 type:complete len:178 (+) Transcript_2439:1252-1785(+)
MIHMIFWIQLLEARECRLEYFGERNFFNETDGKCYPVPDCQENQVYRVESNSCIERNQTPPDIPSTTQTSNETVVEDKPIKCLHGELVDEVCKCKEGFTTSNSQNASAPFVYLCNVEVDEETDSQFEAGNNQELYLSEQSEDSLSFFEKFLVVFCVGSFLCCVSCCLKKKFKKKYLS